MKQLFPELSEPQRVNMLQQTADLIEKKTYYKPLTPDELDARRETLTDNAIKLSEFEDQKKELLGVIKTQTDPLIKENKRLLFEVKTRSTETEGNLYHIADYDAGMMETFDEGGFLLYSRRLRPDEKQHNIFNLNKASNL